MTNPAMIGLVCLGVMAALAVATAPAAQPPVRVDSGPSVVSVFEGDRLLMEYAFANVPFKPYVRRFFTPSGVNVLRDMVADHPHHHALMFAVGVDGVDFWAEAKTNGREVHKGFGQLKAIAPDSLLPAVLTETLDWVGPADDRPLASERRTVEVYHGPAQGASLLGWRTVLAPAEGKASIKLFGSHYFGLGLRLPASMDGKAEFFTARGPRDGEVVRGDETMTRGPWMACTGEIEGKPVTVAMFDSPANVRPALWFTMVKSFAYLSGTINLYREPLVVEAAKPLSLCYALAAWDGKIKADEVERLYKRWLELVKPEANKP
jgi:hypothetical protein